MTPASDPHLTPLLCGRCQWHGSVTLPSSGEKHPLWVCYSDEHDRCGIVLAVKYFDLETNKSARMWRAMEGSELSWRHPPDLGLEEPEDMGAVKSALLDIRVMVDQHKNKKGLCRG